MWRNKRHSAGRWQFLVTFGRGWNDHIMSYNELTQSHKVIHGSGEFQIGFANLLETEFSQKSLFVS